MAKRVKINVTENDIMNGIRRKADRCPIARAASRRFPGEIVSAAGDHIAVNGVRLIVPPVAQKFMVEFDCSRPVKPIAFYVEVPNGN